MKIEKKEHLSNILFESGTLRPEDVATAIENSKLSPIDLLMSEDDTGCPVVYYLLLENKSEDLSVIMESYKNDFLLVPPGLWSFALWHEENECHQVLKNFYGYAYYQKINEVVSGISDRITFYRPENIVKYWGAGQVNQFFSNLDNIKYLLSTTENIGNGFTAKEIEHPDLMWGLFYAYHQNDFINEVLAHYTPNDPPRMIDRYKHYEILMNNMNPDTTFLFPKKKTLDTFIDIFGEQTGLSYFVNYIKIRKQVYEMSNKVLSLSSDTMNIIDILEAYPEILKENKDFIAYIRHDSDLFTYALVTELIDKHDLLDNMRDKNLASLTQYRMLNHSTDVKAEKKKRKI